MRTAALAAVLVAAWLVGTDPGRTVWQDPASAASAVTPQTPTCPLAGPVTSRWGPRRDGFHDGVDLAAPAGTPIRAVLAGTVTRSAADDPGYGQYINISNASGTQQYGHMSRRLVHVGDRVIAGQVIARVGSEGQSTGPHLHLRVYPGPARGRGVDPVPWLRARGVWLPCAGKR